MKDEIKFEVLEKAPVLIALHDGDQNILWANMAYQKATGLAMEGLRGRKCWIAWGLKMRCKNCPVTLALETGEEVHGEVIPEKQPDWPLSQGSWLVSARALKDDQGRITGAIEVALEISGRRDEEQGRISEQRNKFTAIVQNALDALIMIDEESRVTYWNPAAERIFGYSSQEMMGRDPHKILMPEEYRERFKRGFEHFRKTGTGTAVGKVLELHAKKRSGKTIPIEIAVAPLIKGGVHQAVATIRDVSARKAQEEKIEHQAKILQDLYGVASRLTGSLDLMETAMEVVRSCVEVFGVSLAWIGYAEKDGSVRYLAHSPEEISYPKEISVRWDETDEGKGPTGRTIREGNPQICQDIRLEPTFSSWKDIAIKFGIRSSVAFPLITRGKIFGSLNLYSDKVGFFTPGRVEYLKNLSQIAAGFLENARLYEESNRRVKRITALRNIDMAISGTLDIRIVYRVALDEIMKELKLDGALILTLNPHTDTLEFADGRGFQGKEIQLIHVSAEEATAGRVVRELRIIHIPDLSEVDKKVFTRRDLMLKEGFVSYYGVPLVAKGHLLGVLEVLRKEKQNDSEEWMDFLETLAGQMAIAIENAGLVDNLRHKHLDLLQAYDNTIEGWGTALSLKEEETAEHSERVTQMTVNMARKMGIRGDDLVHVRRGALLHDIGKIGIPDSILLKPGKLTEEEWEIMRKHPVYAFEMLSPISYLSRAIDIPYCHHEKWDGTGYPRGLKGKQIPLSARVFAVVDVWDALTSDRPYRKAWPEEKVLNTLKSKQGRILTLRW